MSEDSERIRQVYKNMGDLHYTNGELTAALHSYVCTLLHCGTPKDRAEMCLDVILVSIELKNFANVLEFTRVAEDISDTLDPVMVSKLRIASALACMKINRHQLAATKFVETEFEFASMYSEIIAPRDVAIYGALCAILSFDPPMVKVKVMDSHFHKFLDILPEMKDLITDYCSGYYMVCFEDLEKLKLHLLMDIHLNEHTEELCAHIRSKLKNLEDDRMSLPLDDFVNLIPLDPDQENVQNDLTEDLDLDCMFEQQLDEQLDTPPLQEGAVVEYVPLEEAAEEAAEEAPGQHLGDAPQLMSMMKLPNGFNENTSLINSPHYRYATAKDLLEALSRCRTKWIPMNLSYALLLNAAAFAVDMYSDEDKFDKGAVLLNQETYDHVTLSRASYNCTEEQLNEIEFKEKDGSLVVRHDIVGSSWMRRRTQLRINNDFHLLQWRINTRQPRKGKGVSNSGLLKALEAHSASVHQKIEGMKTPSEAIAAQSKTLQENNELLKKLVNALCTTPV